LVKPEAPISYGAAQIHHLTDDKLIAAPTYAQLETQILDLCRFRRVIIYNAAFDLGILRNEITRNLHSLYGHQFADERSLHRWARAEADRMISGFTAHCAMDAYSTYVGDWNDHHGNYRWQRLPSGDHSALGDCRATLQVLRKIVEE
jgi:DNA polymerase-3 subunit epsilon